MFHKYPYTNFHELNADWLIETTMKTEEAVEQVKTELRELDNKVTEEIQKVNTKVDTGLSNLDKKLTTELGKVDAKLETETGEAVQGLLNSGAFDAQIKEQIGKETAQLTATIQEVCKEVQTNTDNIETMASLLEIPLQQLIGYNILIIGDSNSDENWGSNLNKHWPTELNTLIRNLRDSGTTITNVSEGGQKMAWGSQKLQEENAAGHKYDIVIIMLGTNDYGHATPIEEFKATLNNFPYPVPKQTTALFKGSPTVFVVSPPKRVLETTSETKRVPMTAYCRALYSWAISRGWNFIDCWGKQPYINVNDANIMAEYYYDKKAHFGDKYARTFALWILSYLLGNKSDSIGEYREIVKGATIEALFTLPLFRLNSNGSYIEYSTSHVKFNILGTINNSSNFIGLRTIGYLPPWALPTDSIYYLTCEKSTITVADKVNVYPCLINTTTKAIMVDVTEVGQTTAFVRITGQISTPQGLFDDLNQIK